MTVQQSFEIALGHHQSGRLAEAGNLYRRVLAAEPAHAEALHMLGLLEHQSGRPAEAEQWIGKAIGLMPKNAGCHSNLCDVLRVLGRLEEAAEAGRRAIALRPDSAIAHNNLGNVFNDMGRRDGAIAAYRRTLELAPDDADVWRNLGNVLKGSGRIEEAIAAFRSAVALVPGDALTLNILGGLLRDRGLTGEAIAVLGRAVSLQPGLAEAHYNLGNALRDADRLDDATREYREAIALRPDFAEAHNNLGNMLAGLDRADAAEQAYRTALNLRPDYVNALHNLGKLLSEQGRRDEAADSLERALSIDPGHARTRLSLGTLHLLKGEFSEGWPLYESRWEAEDFTSPRRSFSQPTWDGASLEGRTLLIHAEQGFGDSVQFVRYATLAAECGGPVIVECPAPLRAVFSTVNGISRVVTSGTRLPHFDVQIPMMSLPQVFGTHLETIPRDVPYIAADAVRCDFWREWLCEKGPSRKVGLAWAGRPTHNGDRMRSMHLRQLLPLMEVAGVEFVSLQFDRGLEQIAELPAGRRVHDPRGNIADFAGTTALISQLDLVIAVDTAVAHLAGALGKPVWVLLPFAPDWRWMLGREDSPWYPTMRLFRQERIGEWDAVIAKVRDQLTAFARSPQ